MHIIYPYLKLYCEYRRCFGSACPLQVILFHQPSAVAFICKIQSETVYKIHYKIYSTEIHVLGPEPSIPCCRWLSTTLHTKKKSLFRWNSDNFGAILFINPLRVTTNHFGFGPKTSQSRTVILWLLQGVRQYLPDFRLLKNWRFSSVEL